MLGASVGDISTSLSGDVLGAGEGGVFFLGISEGVETEAGGSPVALKWGSSGKRVANVRCMAVKHLLFQLRNTELFDMRKGADRSFAHRIDAL